MRQPSGASAWLAQAKHILEVHDCPQVEGREVSGSGTEHLGALWGGRLLQPIPGTGLIPCDHIGSFLSCD